MNILQSCSGIRTAKKVFFCHKKRPEMKDDYLSEVFFWSPDHMIFFQYLKEKKA